LNQCRRHLQRLEAEELEGGVTPYP
jgi:hypothetical protein